MIFDFYKRAKESSQDAGWALTGGPAFMAVYWTAFEHFCTSQLNRLCIAMDSGSFKIIWYLKQISIYRTQLPSGIQFRRSLWPSCSLKDHVLEVYEQFWREMQGFKYKRPADEPIKRTDCTGAGCMTRSFQLSLQDDPCDSTSNMTCLQLPGSKAHIISLKELWSAVSFIYLSQFGWVIAY